MIIKSFFSNPSVTLRECDPSELIPVFSIVHHGWQQTIYLHDGKLWTENTAWTVEKITNKVQLGSISESLRHTLEESWLAAGNTIYEPATEPYYYLEPHNSTVNSMVLATCREDGFLESRRRYTFREREAAVSCANAIIKLVYNEKRDATEKWTPEIIQVFQEYFDSEVAAQ